MSPRTIPLLLLLTTACASTGATFKSGVGDAFLAHPPWYAGARGPVTATAGAKVGILPVLYQAGAAQAVMFDPKGGPDSPVAKLLGEMNAFVDSLTLAGGGAPVRVIDGARISAVAPASMGVAPDVQFGCRTAGDLPGEDCLERGDSALGRGDQRMRLAVGRPSAQWIRWAGEAMDAAGVTHVLVLTVEVGQYLPRQTGLRGDKSVELGTAHVVALPWLTSLETPVQVLQVTGALMDRNGQAVRIGAEGMLAKRTRFLASAFGAQELLTAEDLAALRSRVREDRPGEPLVWKEAMRQLVHGLTTGEMRVGRRDQAFVAVVGSLR